MALPFAFIVSAFVAPSPHPMLLSRRAPAPMLAADGLWTELRRRGTDDFCWLPSDLDPPKRDAVDFAYDFSLLAVPAVVPLLAFMLYPNIMVLYHSIVDVLSANKWYEVDGGLSRLGQLLPLTNGLVVPSVSVAFGTLSAITIQSLRQRQVSIRALLNKEACLLRTLYSASMSIFDGRSYAAERAQLAVLYRQYLARLIFESRIGVDFSQLERIGASDSEMDGVAQVLFDAESKPRASDEPLKLFRSNTEFAALGYLKDLQAHRSERLALLQTPFPLVHWLILATLAGSILLAYLFETDAQLLQFLDNLQLRYLFTLLVGAYAALAALCADLADPFRGSFTVTKSTEQLTSIRDLIYEETCAQEVKLAQEEARQRERANQDNTDKEKAREGEVLVDALGEEGAVRENL